MLNTISRTWLLGGIWIATVSAVIGSSVAMDAALSTTALLLAVGIAPAIVIALIGRGAAAPTVAEVLYSVEKKNG